MVQRGPGQGGMEAEEERVQMAAPDAVDRAPQRKGQPPGLGGELHGPRRQGQPPGPSSTVQGTSVQGMRPGMACAEETGTPALLFFLVGSDEAPIMAPEARGIQSPRGARQTHPCPPTPLPLHAKVRAQPQPGKPQGTIQQPIALPRHP
jgi:hypothetical protein